MGGYVLEYLRRKILQALAADLHDERGGLDLSKCYKDGSTFIVAKKGGELDWSDQAEGQKRYEAHGKNNIK
jgi:hypothetical protein